MKKIIIIILMLILISYVVHGLVSGAELYYKLENNQSEVGGGPNLTELNAPTYVSGKLGNAVNLDDGSSQYLDASPDTNLSRNFTVAAWFKGDDTPGVVEYIVWMANASNEGNRFFSLRRHVNRTIELYGFWHGEKLSASSTTITNNAEWYYIVGVINGTNGSLYINNVLENSVLTTFNGTGLNRFRIGTNRDATGSFDGLIDDVSVSPTARNETWIDQRWNGGGGSELTSFLFWNFPTPSDGAINTTPQTFNFTCGSSGYNGYLWLDTNTDPTTERLGNVTEGIMNWTLTLDDANLGDTLYYKAGCFDDATALFVENSSIRSFIIEDLPIVDSDLNQNSTLVFNNLTFFVNVSDDVIINKYNITLDSIYVNDSLIKKSFSIINYSWNVLNNATGNHTIKITACDSNNCTIRDYVYYKHGETVSFNNVTIEDKLEDIRLNLDLTGTPYNYQNVSVVLLYNNTKYTPTRSGEKTIEYLSTVITPNISLSNENVLFHWEYNISGFTFDSSNQTQNVGSLILIECDETYQTFSLNISVFNESAQTQSVILDSLDQTYQVFNSLGSPTQSFNFTNTTLSNFSLCVFPNVSIITDFQIDYVLDTVHFTYFGRSVNLSNETKILNLFVQDGTTQITYTVKDIFDDNIADVFITVEKFDVGTNSFKTVEILKTGTDGTAIGRAVLFTEWYRFTLVHNGITRLVEGPLKLISVTRTFRIDISPGDWIDQLQDATKLTSTLKYNNDTKTFTLTWTDNALTLNKICLEVINVTPQGETIIGTDNCATSASGSLNQNVGGDVDDQMFIAKAFGYIAGAETGRFLLDILEKSFLKEFLFYNQEKVKGLGVFVTFMLVLSMFFIGLWHPAASIILGILAFGVSRMLGFYYMSWVAFMALLVIGGMIIWKSVRAK